LSTYQNNRGLSATDLTTIADVDGDGQITNRDLQSLISAVANVQAGSGASSAAVSAAPADLVGISKVGGSMDSSATAEPVTVSKVGVVLLMSDNSRSSIEPVATPSLVLAESASEPLSIADLYPTYRYRQAAPWHYIVHSTRNAKNVDDLFSTDAELLWK
ncbi:MAG TPA: hypothetical protein VGI75_06655, partial [Pirellulales bacterium]